MIINEIEGLKIFLDDTRDPIDNSWTIARSFEEFKSLISNATQPITHLSLDHDLGEDDWGFVQPTGMDATKWFVEQVQNNPSLGGSLSMVISHSANPVGNNNIALYFESAIKSGIFDSDLKVKSLI